MLSSDSQPAKPNGFFQFILPWVTWGLGCVFYFYEFLLQVSPGVMAPELMRDFAITGQTLGFLSGFYYYAYSPMQLPCGLLMDHYGPRRLLTAATAICAIGTLIFSFTDSLLLAFVARLMIGFGSAFAAVGTMKLAANWFNAERFALLTGFMVTIGMLGAIGGEVPLALLVDHYGWRHSMTGFGFVGLALALVIFIVVGDHPKNARLVKHPHHEPEQSKLLTSLFVILKNKQLWLLATYGGLMYMATPVFCGLWGVPFLMYKMHITKAVAANYISVVLIGWAIAGPLWGIYSNRIGLRKPPMYIGAIGACTASALFIYLPIQSGWIMELLLFIFGISSAGFLCAFSSARELCHKAHVGTGLGFMNMFNMVGVAVAQPFIGFALDKYWAGEIIENVRVYPLHAYHIGLAILPIGMFISIVMLRYIKETHCQPIDQYQATEVKAAELKGREATA